MTSLADLMRSPASGSLRSPDFVETEGFADQFECPTDSKALYRTAARAATREAVLPNPGRVQQENLLWYARYYLREFLQRVVPRSTTAPQVDYRVLQRFEGFVEKVEGDLAFVTLDNGLGERLSGPYPADELAAKGVRERDRFVLTTVEHGDSVRFDILPVPRRTVTADRRRQIRDEIERELGGYTPGDDY